EYDVAVSDFSTYTPLLTPRNRPVGITVHHLTGPAALARWSGWIGRMVVAQEQWRLRRGRFFSATSHATAERLRAVVGPDPLIRVIQAGVPDALFALPRRESDYLLYFGRLDWNHKGLDVLLQAMEMLVDAYPDLRLKVAGRGKDAERLLREARTAGIRENIELIGGV